MDEKEFEKMFGDLFSKKSAIEKKYPNIAKYPESVQQCLHLGEELLKSLAKLEKLSK